MTAAKPTKAEALRESGHPLFNDRKLKLGTFASNIKGGCIKSTIDGQADATWASTLGIAQVSDAMGFEALVPLGRWRGHGGVTNHAGSSLESYTWAAAVGASVQQSCVFSTSHVSTVHPLMAAKQSATIDTITSGRFALNLVCGWDKPEMEMFGVPMLDHEERYDCALEWLQIIERLWTEEEPVDFDGKYYRIQQACISPQPVAKPSPPVMNAGTSERGRHFAAKNCDIAFVQPSDLDSARAQVQAYRDIARNEYGRDIQIWSWASVVQGDTEADAQRLYQEYVHEKGDWDCSQGMMDALGLSSPPLPAEMMQTYREFLVAGGGFPIMGSHEQIVDKLAELSDVGFDGVLLSWPRYLDGIRQFQTHTLPLLEQAGLR